MTSSEDASAAKAAVTPDILMLLSVAPGQATPAATSRAYKSAVAWDALNDLSRIGRTREASRRMRKLTKDLSPAARPKRRPKCWKNSLVMRTGQKSELDTTRQDDLPMWSWSFFTVGKVMMMSSPASSKWQALSCLKQASLHRV
jgi:hypothetical protein